MTSIAPVVKVNAKQARPMIAAIFLASVMGAILSWEFIFPLPVAFFSLIAGLLATSYFESRGIAVTR